MLWGNITFFILLYQILNTFYFVPRLCLNSIIDISNETADSQRQLFDDVQWKILKKQFKRTQKFDDDTFKNKLKDINKVHFVITCFLAAINLKY
jgi:hypothetical protein